MAHTARDRQRAYRIRHSLDTGENVEPDDRDWLAEYDADKSQAMSASERIVNIEERSLAQASGPAAEALAAASMAREEGRRIDTLTNTAINALVRACDMYHRMASDMLARSTKLEEHSVAMLDSIRDQFLERVNTEGELARALASMDGDGDDNIAQTAESLLKILAANSQKSAKKSNEKE